MSATSPYRTHMATQQSAHHTPSRRALGDLTPRALNSPATQARNAGSSEAIPARSPLKKVTSHIPNVFADKENFETSAFSHGKKRGIEEVEDAEKAGGAKMLAHGARDESLWQSGMRLTTDAVQRHTENNPAGLADPGSPTERNTPTPEPEIPQDSQKSNQSFSDLLNYELCASQKSEHGADPASTSMPSASHAPQTPPQTYSSASARPTKDAKKSRAELLRTRLKFGLYKVKTHQESKRGSDIISSFEASSSPPSSIEVPNITISSPRRDGPVFIKANLDPFRPIGRLGQPPVLFAVPQDLIAQPNVSHRAQLGEHADTDISETARDRLQRLKEDRFLTEDLSSNAVQGSAAVGLMELMSGRR